MTPSAAHLAARDAGARLGALEASLALLRGGQGAIRLYDAADGLLGALPLADPPGAVDDDLYRLVFATPIEGLIAGAGPIAAAEIVGGDGALWGEAVTVSAVGGGGELEFETLDPPVGTFVRLVSGIVQG
jgi:hypothetical protein